MPEIGEVARIVNRLRSSLVGKTITEITVFEDNTVYKDTTHDAFKNALEGKRVIEARQWGKYFWLVMDSPPHPLMHFGMSGWIYIKNDPYAHYRIAATKVPEWPPKYIKFNLQLSNADEIAFTDSRRLGRIRLIDHPNGDLRGISPLLENGPDPVLEPVSIEWITEKLLKRKVPAKAWLLDQATLAGVGNWVGDEILYHARVHPEQQTNTLSTDQIASLHKALGYVTKLAVDMEADSGRFPENWLMLHRWGKGAGKEHMLPSGENIEFVKVGSRTSAFVPSLQKMPGKEEDDEDKGGGEGSGSEPVVEKPAKKRAPKKVPKKGEDDKISETGEKPASKKRVPKKTAKKEDEDGGIDEKPAPKKRAPAISAKEGAKEEEEEENEPESPKPRKRKRATRVKESSKKTKH